MKNKMMPVNIPWLIVFGSLVQVVWAISIFMDDVAIKITSLSAFDTLLTPTIAGIVILFSGICGLLSSNLKLSHNLRILFGIPFHITSLITAISSGRAVVISQFGDGVERHRTFILADQVYGILFVIILTIAYKEIYSRISVEKIVRILTEKKDS